VETTPKDGEMMREDQEREREGERERERERWEFETMGTNEDLSIGACPEVIHILYVEVHIISHCS
jgi:hypothetical protein